MATLAVCSSITAGALTASSGAASASGYDDDNRASMICGYLSGNISFGLPMWSDGHYSFFYYRVNGGGWQHMGTYWTWLNQKWWWNGNSWEQLAVDASAGFVTIGTALVEGYELRMYPNGTTYGVPLASCWAVDGWGGPGGPIIFL